MFNGKMRKLVLTAARNGYFFTLDRVTGEHLVTSKYGLLTNWANGLNKAGAPQHDPGKGCDGGRLAGVADTPTAPSTGSRRPSLPIPGCSIRRRATAYSIFYLTDVDPRGSMGLGGKEEAGVGSGGSFLTAIDYKTGKVAWRHPYYGNGGGGGLAGHGGQTAVCGRWRGQPGGARCGHRKAAVAHAHRRTSRMRRRRSCWMAIST